MTLPLRLTHRSVFWLAVACTFLLAGCAGTSSQSRRETAEKLTTPKGWVLSMLPAGAFVLAAYGPAGPQRTEAGHDTLTVYIEGDGFAWRSKRMPSDDPTPINPVALELALKHADAAPQDAVAYLARPCQYVTGADARNCDEDYWTTRRFAGDVIGATDAALTSLKQRRGAKSLVLVGYSGGAAVSALVAARRSDVSRLVTVAGTLDHRAWTGLHKVTPLDASLNPADVTGKLQTLPQHHFVGGKDAVMPVAVAESYRARFPPGKKPIVEVIAEFDHVCCWAERWPVLMATAFSARAK